MILARPPPNTPPARYQGCGRRRFNGAVKTHNKKPQLPLNGALRDSVRTRGGGLRKAAGARMGRGYHLGLLRMGGRFRGRGRRKRGRKFWRRRLFRRIGEEEVRAALRTWQRRGGAGKCRREFLEEVEQEAEEEDFFDVYPEKQDYLYRKKAYCKM